MYEFSCNLVIVRRRASENVREIKVTYSFRIRKTRAATSAGESLPERDALKAGFADDSRADSIVRVEVDFALDTLSREYEIENRSQVHALIFKIINPIFSLRMGEKGSKQA